MNITKYYTKYMTHEHVSCLLIDWYPSYKKVHFIQQIIFNEAMNQYYVGWRNSEDIFFQKTRFSIYFLNLTEIRFVLDLYSNIIRLDKKYYIGITNYGYNYISNYSKNEQ